MVEITGIKIAFRGRGEVDQGSIFLSFLVNIAHFGGLLENILWRVEGPKRSIPEMYKKGTDNYTVSHSLIFHII